MKCRRSVAELSPADKAQLVQAFLDLKNESESRIPEAAAAVEAGGGKANRYDDYVWMHNTVRNGAHRGPSFGPWHREFLLQFEADLQDVSGDPNLTLPYWDWLTARTPDDPGWPFTSDFLGGFGDAGPGPTTGYVSTPPFDSPDTWRINIRRRNDADIRLKRSRGLPDPSVLPTLDDVLFAVGAGVPAGTIWPRVYDLPPWNDHDAAPSGTQLSRSFRKVLERVLHDSIHGWVGDAWELVGAVPQDGGHMSFPSVSVNDPVFWLHHGNVDRLWAYRQRKVPGSGYQPTAGGTAENGHNADDVMIQFATPAWFAHPIHPTPRSVENHHSLGYWYSSDLPEVTPDVLSVDFGPVGEAGTASRPITFTVRACRPVSLRATDVTGARFHVPAATTVDDVPGAGTTTAQLSVELRTEGPLTAPETGSVTVEATTVDVDGFDTAAPGDTLVLGSWTVELSADPAETPAFDGHGHHHGDHGDHDAMVFSVWRRTPEGDIVEIPAAAVARDTRRYDRDGHDRAQPR